MSEFIGSRISLISKSDIRYVGTLHEINSESSTVALGQVTSFGTEGRRNNPDDELPASDHVYEYIVFRGSDVKDLRIEEPPKDNSPPPPEPQVPNDPAILGSGSRPQQPHVPSQQGDQSRNGPGPSAFQPQSSFPPYQQYGQYQQQGFRGPYGAPQHDFGPPAPFQGYGPSPYGGPQRWGGMPPYQQGFHPPPGAFSPNHPNMMFGPPGMPPNPDPSRGPVPPSQQSPPEGKPAAGPEQASNGRPAIEGQPSGPTASTNPLPAVAQGPPPPMSSKPDVAAAIAPPISNVDPMAIRKPAAAPAAPMSGKIIPAIPFAKKPLASTGMTKTAPVAVASHATGTQAATAAVAAAMAKLGPAPGQQKPISSRSNNDSEAAMDNLTRKVNAMRTDERIRHSDQPGTGGFAAGNRGGRGRAARGGRGRGAHRDSIGHGQVRPLDVPTTDFDFESANAKFNKQDLVKEAIATGEPSDGNIDTSTAAANGDANYNGDQAASKSTGDVLIPSAPPTYDKSSSFFDNISSEAKERESSAADGRRGGGREFRTEERKRNMETFGLGSVDSYRGGRRGRGRGRGFGRGTFRGRGNMAEFAINGGPGAEA